MYSNSTKTTQKKKTVKWGFNDMGIVNTTPSCTIQYDLQAKCLSAQNLLFDSFVRGYTEHWLNESPRIKACIMQNG